MSKLKRIFCAALCLAAVLLFSACSTASDEDTAPSEELTSTPAPAASEEASPAVPDAEPTPTPEAGAEDGSEPPESPPASGEPEKTDTAQPASEAPAETAAPAAAPQPNWMPVGGAVVPAQAAPVDDAYFDDAAFIGNSLVDGFRMFSGLSNCDYYAATSMTIFGIDDYITQMSSVTYGKIYMLLGINELTYNMDSLMRAYGNALDRLMADHPGAVIYVMGVSPVSAAKEASSSIFTMANVRRFNENLLQLVQEKNCCYIDLCDALGGSDGYLPADVTTDGVHFVASEYRVWRDYLRLHYIPAA